jgi:hypothetical protein
MEGVALTNFIEAALLLVHFVNECADPICGAAAVLHHRCELRALATCLARRAQLHEESKAFVQESAELVEPLSLAGVVAGEGSEAIELGPPVRLGAFVGAQERRIAPHGISAHSTFGIDEGRLQIREDHAHLVRVLDPLMGASKGQE